jgi:hypothetical protein
LLPDHPNATWTGPNSIQHDEGEAALAATTRELRTRSSTPSAPRLDTLFARDGVTPQQVVVVWDAGQTWPTFSLTQLAVGAQSRLHRVLLRQENVREPLAEFWLTMLSGTEDNRWGVVEVVTAPGDPLGVRIALTLLEQADRPVVLAGGPGDKDLVRRIGEFVRSAQWTGPSLLMVTPADKPSRADRLRKSGWPRGLRIHVLEMFNSPNADWTEQLLGMVRGDPPAGDVAPSAPTRPAPANVGQTEGVPLRHAPEASPTAALLSVPGRSARTSDAGNRAGEAGVATALALAAQAPGVLACALVDADDGTLAASLGLADAASDAAARAARMWQAHGGEDPSPSGSNALDELTWSTAACHHLAVTVPGRAGHLLLAVVDRAWGDIPTTRWHLAVARNHLL